MNKEKEYKITFTTDYLEYEKWAKTSKYWKECVDNNLENLKLCKKYSGKTVKLSELPTFIKEVGDCVISDDEIEIYNDYRE